MKLIAVLAACAVMAGCAGGGKLIRGTQAYPVDFNPVSKSISTTIDGETYSGTYVLSRSFGTASGFSGTTFTTTSFSSTSAQGRALLTSPSGKVLRCEFLVDGLSAIGQCQDAQGAVYDLTAG